MKKIIINADDFGLREGINRGIITAYKNGVVSSASLFVDKEATESAVALFRENPGLGLGVHIDLDRFFYIDHERGIITDWVMPKPAISDVLKTVEEQIQKYLSFNLPLDHLDSHHHSHLHPEIFPAILDIATKYNIKVVRFFKAFYNNESVYNQLRQIYQEKGLILIDHFIEGWYWGNVDEPYQIAELMTHPGYDELWREAELAHCCQPQLKEYFYQQKIELLRFADLL